MTDGVLTLVFDRKIAVDPNALAQGLSAYISSIRADPDGRNISFRARPKRAAAHKHFRQQDRDRSCAASFCRRASGITAASATASTRGRCREAQRAPAPCRRLFQFYAAGIRLAEECFLCRVPRRGPHHDPLRGDGAARFRILRARLSALGERGGVARRKQGDRDRIRYGLFLRLSRFPGRQQNRTRYPGAEIGCRGVSSAGLRKRRQAENHEARRKHRQRHIDCAGRGDCRHSRKAESRYTGADSRAAGLSTTSAPPTPMTAANAPAVR
jgi:hypothetical protein